MPSSDVRRHRSVGELPSSLGKTFGALRDARVSSALLGMRRFVCAAHTTASDSESSCPAPGSGLLAGPGVKPCAGHPRLSSSAMPQGRRGWPGQAHGCPARFMLSCRLLHGGTSTTCAATLSRSGSGQPEIECGSVVVWDLAAGDIWRSSAIGRRCMRFARMSLAKASGLCDDFVGVMRQAQQQKGDQRNRDLNANGVLGGSEEVADFQGLFDPSKEQLDGPSALVQIGDFLCARGQIIGEDAQHLAGLDHDLDFADQTRHRIVAGSGKPLRKVSDPIAQDRRSRRRLADPRPPQKACWP